MLLPHFANSDYYLAKIAMYVEETILLGQLPLKVKGDVVCVDKLKDRTSLEDYIQYKCRNSAGRDVSYLVRCDNTLHGV